ncbi:hypothetical protein HDV04_001698 [Boothiomyces sp. JEL0838]|nr:hypothetical protein HDV04_001698 [Boothiomyces sp. JEL0838]
MVYYFTSTVVDPPALIYVGKDKFENEELIEHAWDCDVWQSVIEYRFHVDKLSSAHVYLRLQQGQTWDNIPQLLLDDLAQLTKANSIEGNKKDNLTIIYTPSTNLKKTADMETGQVAFHKNKMVKKVHVETRQNAIVNRLNKTKKEEYPDLLELKKVQRRAKRLEEEEMEEYIKQKRKEKENKNYSSFLKEEYMYSNKGLDMTKSAQELEEDFILSLSVMDVLRTLTSSRKKQPNIATKLPQEAGDKQSPQSAKSPSISGSPTTSKSNFKIIAGVFPTETIPEPLAKKCHSVLNLDYDAVTTVNKAFEHDIDYLFLIPSKSEERALQAKRLISVAVERNIKFICLVSLLDCHTRSGMLAAQFRYIEQYIEATGIPYTFLRCAPLQQNFLDMKAQFHKPLAAIQIPISTGGFAPVHARDVATAASAVLADIKKHSGKVYRLTGPELLTGVGIAGKASEGLERPVKFVNKPPPTTTGPSWAKFLDLELYSLIAKGFFTSVSNDMLLLTGKKAISLEDFFKEHKAEFNQLSSSKL